MKKYIFITAVAIVSTLVYIKSNQGNNALLKSINMSAIEAIAGCEVQSNSNLNQGYCIRGYNSTEDQCMEKGPENAVRCSGTI